MTTVFKKIIDGDLPAEKVFESESFIAIKDINPVAPVHILIIPKKPIENLQSMNEEDRGLMSELVEIAQGLANEYNVADSYRLITNNGRSAGQTVFHLHFHLIGGRTLGPMA